MSEALEKTAPELDETSKAPASVLAAPGEDGTAAPAASGWREDWRDAMATRDGKLDEKTRRELDRYADPTAILTSYQALRGQRDRGELRAALAPDAKPEEVTAWRAANGIPEKPEGYLEKVPSGLVIGETDRPLIQEFLAAVHGQNATPAVAHAALQAYYKIQETQAAEGAVKDHEFNRATEDALRVEWGADYRANINGVAGLIRTMAPEGTYENLLGARMANGRPLASDPNLMRFLNTLAREINPAASIVPGAGASAGKGVDERIKEIETVMRTARRTYDKDDGMQKELLSLYEARERLSSRAA